MAASATTRVCLYWEMRWSSTRIRTHLPKSPDSKVRLLKKCLAELKAIYAEALRVQNELLVNSAAEIV
jgi:hypothetical protein